ncbi:hypothetical protein [Pontiella sp.]|uniref:hypothetical protein n=1 Tax=Pontiella sp. TaxID=2837462 RepID=UPI003563CEC9
MKNESNQQNSKDGKVVNVPKAEELIPRKGNYKALITYQKAEAIYDMTYYFCKNDLQRGDRTVDQMVLAARSGKQTRSGAGVKRRQRSGNIVEGSAVYCKNCRAGMGEARILPAVRRKGLLRQPFPPYNHTILPIKTCVEAELPDGGMREKMTRLRIERRNQNRGGRS